MGEATGLGPLEVAALGSIEALTGSGDLVSTQRVLADVEARHGIGPHYLLPVLRDLAVPWQTLVHPVLGEGNWGAGVSTPMADARYTSVGLSEVGRLALAAEGAALGPVPIGLLNGTAYRGGTVPSLAPGPTLEILEHLVTGGSLPDHAGHADLARLVVLPTRGTVDDGLADLVGGGPARVVCGSRIERVVVPDLRRGAPGRPALVVSGTPLHHDLEELEGWLEQRSSLDRHLADGGRRYADYLPEAERDVTPEAGPSGVADIRDETDRDSGRLVLRLRDGADPDVVEEWVRSVWPVTVVVDWEFPGGLAAVLHDWAQRCRADPSGLRALRAAL